MNKFNTLYEAMSRRNFLQGGKKSKKDPEQVQPTELEIPKPPAKKPKGMNRREFFKRTGGSSVLGALTPIDAMIQGWPAIMSQVASHNKMTFGLNANLIKYFNFLVKTGGGQSGHVVGNEGVISGDNIITSIVNLIPSKPEYKNKLRDFSLFNQASKYLDKIKQGNLNGNEQRDIVRILSRMPGMVELNKSISDDVGKPQNIINTFMSHSEHFEVWEDMFKDILSIGIQNKLITNDTLVKLKNIAKTYNGMLPEVEDELIKKGLAKDKDISAKDNVSINNPTDEEIKKRREEIKKRHEEYDKHKKEVDEIDKEQKKERQKKQQKREYTKQAKSINYSRMDRAGGSEDVGYAKYYEHMRYDALVNKILNEVVGPNSPGDDSLPSPQKDYRWSSGKLTPEIIKQIQGKANTPKAIKDIVSELILEMDRHFENDDKHWKPFVERLLRENKSQSLKDLLESATPQRLKSLANILLLAGKSIFIKLGQEQNAQVASQLHKGLMELFK